MRIISNEDDFSKILNGEDPLFRPTEGNLLIIKDLKIETSLNITTIVKPEFNIVFLKNITFDYHVKIEDCHFKRFSINGYNIEFKENFSILDCNIERSILINNCKFFHHLNIENSITNELRIGNIQVNEINIQEINKLEILNFSGLKAQKILLIGISELTKLRIESKNNRKTEIDKVEMNINCQVNIGSNGELIKIDSIKISGGISRGNDMFLSNLLAQNITFENFTNLGSCNISNLNRQKRNLHDTSIKFIKIFKSDLGILNIYDSDLKEMKLFFKGSKLDNLFISSTDFIEPENINDSNFKPDNDEYTSRDKIDIYSQLRKAFENSGNFLKSTKFHKFELEFRLESLKNDNFIEKKDIYSQLKKMYEQRGDSVKSLEYQAKELEIHMNSPQISSSERLNLKFAFWSNNFGTDWKKAFWFLIKWSIPFYMIFILLQGHRLGGDFNLLLDIIANYFAFLNPLREPDFFVTNNEPEKINSLARIVDFFARIFIAFAEYQLIQAFRKYGKK